MNLQCNEIQLLLTEYAVGDLSPAESLVVEVHLAECPLCREELQREYRLRNLLGNLPVRALRGEGLPSVETVGERSSIRPSWTHRPLLAAAGLAAVLAILFLVDDFRAPSQAPTNADQARTTGSNPAWTRAELDSAQDQVAYSLALTARILQKSERTAVHQVFGEKLPQVISESLHKAINTNQGDQG